jgi:hypothetical protein
MADDGTGRNEKMKFLHEQSSNQQEQKPPQQKKQNMEL